MEKKFNKIRNKLKVIFKNPLRGAGGQRGGALTLGVADVF